MRFMHNKEDEKPSGKEVNRTGRFLLRGFVLFSRGMYGIRGNGIGEAFM